MSAGFDDPGYNINGYTVGIEYDHNRLDMVELGTGRGLFVVQFDWFRCEILVRDSCMDYFIFKTDLFRTKVGGL